MGSMIRARIAMSLITIAAVGGGGYFLYLNLPLLRRKAKSSDLFQTINLFGEILILTESEPDSLTPDALSYQPYSSSTEYSTNKAKFGGKYGRLLADATATNDETWWKNNFKLKKASISKEDATFKDFADKDEEGADLVQELKDRCKATYAKDEMEIDDEELFNAWILCSPINTVPIPVMDFRNKYKGKLASERDYSSLFLEDRPANKNVWEEIYEKVWKKDNTPSPKSEQFKGITVAYKKDKPKQATEGQPVQVSSTTPEKALNKICSEAYTSTKEEVESNPNYKEDIINFCSLITQ